VQLSLRLLFLSSIKFGVIAIAAAAVIAGTSRAQAEARLLVDADSGKVLQADNATSPWYPASVTKLTTLYVTLKALKTGRITGDTLFTLSANAFAQAPSKMGFPIGTQVTVDNAIKMMMVHSANDMAVLLAEGVSGSIEKFADEMNDTAQQLGMTQTSYVNPNGLPAEGQITSARDLAILARALIHDFPEYDFYWHIPAIRFGRRVMHNYNPLIEHFPGADGMKTGFICASGFNLVATATRNDHHLIAVVLGASSGSARTLTAAQMLENGFASNPLSWLTPSFGSVNDLRPINAGPANLHDEICGKHHKRARAENEEAETTPEAAPEADGSDQGAPPATLMLSDAAAKPGTLLVASMPSIQPIVVFTGPPDGTPRRPSAAMAKAAVANADSDLQSALRAAQSGDTAATALAAAKDASADPQVPAADPVPLPRPRPKIAKLKSAAQ
jgi:D-alanyl-D-alanine carboxypeptidase